MNLLPREYVDAPAAAEISGRPGLRRVAIAAVLACAGELLARFCSGAT
jgi:hypothetical protein